jgi:hypothetical protein
MTIRTTVLLLGCSFFLSSSFAAKAPMRVNTGRPAKLDTLEAVPGYGIKLHLAANPACMIDGKLNIRKFESQENLESVDTGKLEPVRIVHLYVIANPDCADGAKKPKKKQVFEVASDQRRMTHVYLTYENPVTLENVETSK